ncbi:MAG: class I SAM-dependent methyltransferase [Myxococcota bacterium]|nr:class I SAM-dependent methyltransferase [Myxococcota bacterium]
MTGTELPPPSPFFAAHEEALRDAARLGPLLDLACGRGRHALLLARWGLPVVALDRSREALVELSRRARLEQLPIAPVRADLEGGLPPPLAAARFGAVIVSRYLHRPLAPGISGLLAAGGLLLYETFLRRQTELGWGPRNPDFLLAAGELPGLFPELEVLESHEGLSSGDRPAWLATLVARRR